jgi:hypothetical protein
MRELENYWRECLILALMLSVLIASLVMADAFGGVGEDAVRTGLGLRAQL